MTQTSKIFDKGRFYIVGGGGLRIALMTCCGCVAGCDKNYINNDYTVADLGDVTPLKVAAGSAHCVCLTGM